MKKKIVFAVLALIMLISVMPAFAQKSPWGNTTIRAMFIAMDAMDQHWLYLNRAAQQAATKAKIFYTMQAPFNKVDTAQQINIMEDAINSKYDIILVAPQQATSMIPTINKARAAGIKVIIVDSPLPDGSAHDGFIGTDNAAAARLAADTLAKQIGGKGKVAIVNAQPGAGTTQIREVEFKAQIAAKYPNITIVGTQYSDGLVDRAQNIALDFMTANPDLAGFYACNERSTIGVGNGIKQAGKSGKIVFVGWDKTAETQALVLEGVLYATIIQNPAMMGTKGIEYGMALLSGKTVPQKTDSGCIVGTKSNILKL